MKSGSPSRTTAAHKTQTKVQAWSSLVFHCRHSSFNPSEAPPWDSRPVSDAGVVHYHLLHRPRSVPTALGPTPLATITSTYTTLRIMHTRVAVTPRVCIIFLIIQRLWVNYSAYTSVATLKDIDQMIYFKAFVRFLYFNRGCEEDYFFCISSNTSLANNKTSF